MSETAPPNTLLVPGEICKDTYTVHCFIGEGAFAEVYRVEHRFLGLQAFKVLKPDKIDREVQSSLVSEATILSHLTHPNVVRVFEANSFEKNGRELFFICMEFISGETLFQLLRRKIRIDLPLALSIQREICAGLSIAHQQIPPVIHRDIKPQNVLLSYDTPTPIAKVSDFGVAKAVDTRTRMTGSAGTITYLPPEGFWGFHTPASDVFSAGIVLYHMITGMPPWIYDFTGVEDDMRALETAVLKGRKRNPERPSSINDQCDSQLDEIVLKAIATDQSERFKDATEFLNVLTDYGKGKKKSVVQKNDEDGVKSTQGGKQTNSSKDIMNVSRASQLAFSLAVMETEALGSLYLSSQNLFLGLLKVEDILTLSAEELKMERVEFEETKAEIREFRQFLDSINLDPRRARRRLRKLIYEAEEEKGSFTGHRTPQCREVFAVAAQIAKLEEKAAVGLKHLFGVILNQDLPLIKQLFSELSVPLEGSEIVEGLFQQEGVNIARIRAITKEREDVSTSRKTESSGTPFLDRFGRDLTRLAKEDKLDPVIGRHDEIQKLFQILLQKRKNNPILVGDAGVGKTCIVEALAQRIVANDAPPQIKNFRIVELNLGKLLAGTKYRGEFEERLEIVLKEAASNPNIIIFIDEIHTMIGAGRAEGALDGGDILKPVLARGEIRCIGATTTAEYRRYIEKDPAFERRFQLVWVDEPSREEAVLILKGLRERFEKHHQVKIPNEVIERSVELSMRYLKDFRLPDKAVDIVDQACARKQLEVLSTEKEGESQLSNEVTVEDIAKIISERCRIPIERLTEEEEQRLLKMEEHLCRRVIGQDHAVREVSEAIRAAKAGLQDPRRPMAVFLFLGPTGVGKTELAKALAEFLFSDEDKLIRFDMSEYQEKHAVSKFIGAPPGYIGHDEEGQLTGIVRTNPYAVILFDEIDKVHPDIYDIFLQIFDEGTLRDSRGRKADFRESIIILTSNLGSEIPLRKKPIGFGVEQSSEYRDYEEQILAALTRRFRLEFLNRIQKKIVFHPLSKETVRKVIDKIIDSLQGRLSAKDIQIQLTEAAKDFIFQKGFSETFGAREMERVVEEYVTRPLSGLILKQKLQSGKRVKVEVSEGALQFEIK